MSDTLTRRLASFTALTVLATVVWGAISFWAQEPYDHLLVGISRGLLSLSEPGGGGGTVLLESPGAVEVRPGDPALPAVRLITADRHLSAPLFLALLTVGGGLGVPWRRRVSRVLWGLLLLVILHTAGLLADIEFRPLMESGYRGASYYVFRFVWWVLDVWMILFLPASAALHVYVTDWRGAGRSDPASRGHRLLRAGALIGGLVLLSAGLVSLRPAPGAVEALTGGMEASLPDPAILRDARTAFVEGRFGDAEEAYRDSIDAGPDDPTAHFNLGVSLYRQARFQEAVDEFERARALAPGFPGLDLSLAAALHDMGRREEAIDTFRRADIQGVEDLSLLDQVGAVLLLAGETDAAEAVFDRILVLSPQRVSALFHKGTLAMARGDRTQAIAWFEAARAERPGSLEILNNLGALYQETGRTDEAIRAYRGALSLSSDSLPANFNLGKVLAESGDPCGARPYFTRCLELPDPGGIHARCRAVLEKLAVACDG